MSIIELRSDTFTRPSQAMRQAIAEAEVGDDVWGEDPTVLHLQRQVAELLGKEAALFVASGTMANQVALLSHTHHGDEVLVGWRSHCTTYEAGAGAALAGVMFKTLGENGIFTAHQILTALPPRDVHFAQPTLVWLENTHNAGGGKVFPQHEVERIATVAGERKLALHLDGFQRISVDPCSVTVIRYTELRPFVVRVNDTGGGVADLLPPKKKGRRRRSSSDAVVGGGAGAAD